MNSTQSGHDYARASRWIVGTGLCIVLATAVSACSKTSDAQPSSSSPALTAPATSAALTVPASSSPAVSSGTSPAPATSAPTSSGLTSPVATVTSATTTATAPPDTSCHTAALSLAFGEESGAGGRNYSSYHLKNTSAATCTLGALKLAYVNATGVVVKQVTGASGAVLTLAPGASATLTVSDLATCAKPVATTGLHVTPPTDTVALTVSAKTRACSPEATALTAGTS
jgi:hypothetical protein